MLLVIRQTLGKDVPCGLFSTTRNRTCEGEKTTSTEGGPLFHDSHANELECHSYESFGTIRADIERSCSRMLLEDRHIERYLGGYKGCIASNLTENAGRHQLTCLSGARPGEVLETMKRTSQSPNEKSL